jgi:hypothetical protein
LIHRHVLLRYTRDPAVDYCSIKVFFLVGLFRFAGHGTNLIVYDDYR